MSKKRMREGQQFFRQRFAYHIGQGKSAQQAVELAKAEGQKKFGADWSMILETLLTLLPLILALFKK